MVTPTAAVYEAAEPTWLSIAGGQDHMCGVQADHSLWCWGANRAGQLGYTTVGYGYRTTPAHVTTPGGPWLTVGGGHRETCAIDATQQLWCGGLNAGNLGIPSGGSRRAPVRIGAATSIAAGYYDTCSVDSTVNGTLACWGNNDIGQLADTTTDSRDVPTPLTKTGWQSVSISDHTCAIDSSRHVWCWGYNFYGGVGSASAPIATTTPVDVSGALLWKAVSVNEQTCAISTPGNVYCWGYNGNYQAGYALSTTNPTAPSLVSVGSWTEISAGEGYTCGIDGSNVSCFGANDYGELGSMTAATASPTNATVTGAPFSGLSTGGQHTCVSGAGSAASCWGRDVNGELGNQSQNGGSMPVVEIGSWLRLAAGENFTCGVKADNGSTGSLWCWGGNDSGQLADGTFIEHHEPQQVGSGQRLGHRLRRLAPRAGARRDQQRLLLGPQLRGRSRRRLRLAVHAAARALMLPSS